MRDAASKPVAMVGLPGGGKSTIGRQLARRLACPFVDTDAVIEEQIGCSIRQYFDQAGEVAFRDVEANVIDRLTLSDRTVIATGGGAVLREENRRKLRERCTVIYLRSTPEELYRRLRNDTHRPLLQVDDPLAKLRQLHAERHPFYDQIAHFRVDTGRTSAATVVNTIVMQLDMTWLANPAPPPDEPASS